MSHPFDEHCNCHEDDFDHQHSCGCQNLNHSHDHDFCDCKQNDRFHRHDHDFCECEKNDQIHRHDHGRFTNSRDENKEDRFHTTNINRRHFNQIRHSASNRNISRKRGKMTPLRKRNVNNRLDNRIDDLRKKHFREILDLDELRDLRDLNDLHRLIKLNRKDDDDQKKIIIIF
nr:hypothetical protein [Fredinandcohnia onubensis]